MKDRAAAPGNVAMLSLAAATLVWAVTRACLQSVTMDEAMTYRALVAPASPNYWTPHSNNHLLNSILIRLATTVFGLSQLSLRLPALAGACLYIASCFYLCRVAIVRAPLRMAVFACLLLNPFVADLYVAARGYSFALGFLMCAVAIAAYARFGKGDPLRSAMMASFALGMSFVANFSFAFVCAAAWIALLLWIGVGRDRPLRLFAGTAAAAIAPALLFAPWTLLHWPSGQLFDGVDSLRTTFAVLNAAALHAPNPEIANPLLLSVANAVRPFIAVVVLGLTTLLLLHAAATRRPAGLAFAVVGTIAGALFLHWLAFRLAGIPLPRTRTALYVIPLLTLGAGALADVTGRGRLAALAVIWALAGYYFLCLRLTWFYEWGSQADAKEAYYTVAYYNHRYGVTEVPSRQPISDCLEFYRLASGAETLRQFNDTQRLPYGKDVYVLYEPESAGVIERERLKIVYRGRVDPVLVVAIRPGLEIPDSTLNQRAREVRYDDTDAAIIYHGNWHSDFQFSEPEYGSITYSAHPGDSFELRFTGTSIRYVFTKAPNRGTAEVRIDRALVRTIGMRSDETQWRAEERFGGLRAGEHRFEVRVGAGGGFVDVDLLAVTN